MNDNKNLLEKVLSKAMIEFNKDDAIRQQQSNGEEKLDATSYKAGFLAGAKNMENEARADERRKIISHLKAKNPYPTDIFMGNNKKIKAILYTDRTQSPPDGQFGSFGRKIWNNIIEEIEAIE